MKKVFMTLITFLVICVSIWFQITFLNSIPLAGAIANFGIVLIVGIGLVSGQLIGGVVGLIYGILIDIALYRTLGIYILVYSLTGIMAGILNNSFSKENKISMVMLVLFVTLCFETLIYLFRVLMNKFGFDFWVLSTTLILEAAYNIILTLIFFKPITFLGDLLNRCKNSYYLL